MAKVERRVIGHAEASMLGQHEAMRRGHIFNWVEAINGKWRVCSTDRGFIPRRYFLKGVAAEVEEPAEN